MCGIAGMFDSIDRRWVDHGLLQQMGIALAHRGPDGDGFFTESGIGLAHRRLAIIDLKGGKQPIYNEDGTVVVIYNGEIYNFKELVLELERRGHRFSTRSDTEAIVHGWEEWGPDCVNYFRGMFAFALWDSKAETLFLARDRLGKKPLYYSELPSGWLLFGSELKALACHPEFSREIDPEAVESYFALGYVADPYSIFKGTKKLPPAHRLTWRRGARPRIERYWRLQIKPSAARSESSLTSELVEQLRDAVRLRLISDVPVGAFLSGGVDSSGVVAMMANVCAEPVETFSISFGDARYDESQYAEALARRYQTRHHTRKVDPDSFDLIDRLSAIYDEPFGDSSAMPTFRVCEMARQHVKVALSGDGGDEVFAGYRRYRWHRREEWLRGILPHDIRRPLFGLMARLYPKLDWAPRYLRAKTTFRELGFSSVEGYEHNVAALKCDMREHIYSREFKRELQGYRATEIIRQHMEMADSDDPVIQAQYTDINTYLPGDILVKVDRASMANSLEVRVPLLDHTLVEWSATIPVSAKLRGGEGKYIMKRALEPYVPRELLYRPKQGFEVPLAGWFRGPLAGRIRQLGKSEVLLDAPFLEPAAIQQLIEEHQTGKRNHSTAIWLLLLFESFLRRNAGLVASSRAA